MKYLFFILSLIFFLSCGTDLPELNNQNYKVVGKEGAVGLATTRDNEAILEKKYKSIRILYDMQLGEHYVEFKTNEGGQGYYFDHFEKPTIEVDSSYYYLKIINSKKHFVFTKHEKNYLGYSWQGVIDTEGNEVIPNEYLQILHDGNKIFYIATDKNKNYRQFNLEKDQFNAKYYGWVYSKFGVNYASKDKDGGGDIWGAKGCLLDEEGNEITDHVFQSIGIHKSLFDESTIILTARKNNIHTLFYPNGEEILKDIKGGVSLYKPYNQKAKQKIIEKYPNKNIVGVYREGKTDYFVTYEGEKLVRE